MGKSVVKTTGVSQDGIAITRVNVMPACWLDFASLGMTGSMN